MKIVSRATAGLDVAHEPVVDVAVVAVELDLIAGEILHVYVFEHRRDSGDVNAVGLAIRVPVDRSCIELPAVATD